MTCRILPAGVQTLNTTAVLRGQSLMNLRLHIGLAGIKWLLAALLGSRKHQNRHPVSVAEQDSSFPRLTAKPGTNTA